MYLARQLVEDGHSVTLLTRGKTPICQKIPDDTEEGYLRYKTEIQHIAADRGDHPTLIQKLKGKGFDGRPSPLMHMHYALAPPPPK